MAVAFMIEDEDKRQVSKHRQIYFVLSNFIKVAIKFVKKDRVRNFKEVSQDLAMIQERWFSLTKVLAVTGNHLISSVSFRKFVC